MKFIILIFLLNICFQMISQDIIDEKIVVDKYCFNPFTSKNSSKKDTSLTAYKWLKKQDSIIYLASYLKDPISELKFEGNGYITFSYILSEEELEDGIIANVALDVINGKWKVIKGKVFIVFRKNFCKTKFIFTSNNDEFLMVKKKRYR